MSNELLFLREEKITDSQQALTFLAEQLFSKGYVSKTYIQAVLDREKEFPTGLAFEDYGIAIPHADTEFVKNTKIAVLTLEEPVDFIQMTTSDKKVKVQLIIMLALNEAHAHVEMLQKLMTLLQDKKSVSTILECNMNDIEKVKSILKTYQII